MLTLIDGSILEIKLLHFEWRYKRIKCEQCLNIAWNQIETTNIICTSCLCLTSFSFKSPNLTIGPIISKDIKNDLLELEKEIMIMEYAAITTNENEKANIMSKILSSTND